MAERRMFTKKIIDSDPFLDLPLSSQALYFHLNMRADDDGFVNNARKVQRMIGASDDDLKLLLAKRFLLSCDDGVYVIKHWWMHNVLRKDRYHPTQYQQQKNGLILKENGSYTEAGENLLGDQTATDWQPNGNQMATEYSLSGNSIDLSPPIVPPTGGNADETDHFFARFNAFWAAYPKKVGKKDALKAWKKIRPSEELFGKIMDALNAIKDSAQWRRDGGQFIPYPATWLNGGRWEDDPKAANMVGAQHPQHDNIPSTFNTDEFFERAVKKSYGG